MKILHYFLGFPPYRSGGMTNFVCDLMSFQKEKGNEVIAVYPGRINLGVFKRLKLKEKSPINGIVNYEIINPLPVSLDEGIKEIDKFTKKCDEIQYYDFLNQIRPDIIHIHTLMGLHKEFINVANSMGIKTIFTTHDYFGICPKVTLYRYGKVCDNDYDCKECIRCNYSALSMNKIKLMQSLLYKKLKNSIFVKYLRKKHRTVFFTETQPKFLEDNNELETKKKEYQILRKYYVEMLNNIDLIHFNSNLAKEIYLKYIKPKSYKVISISHKNIKDNRNNKKIESDKIRFTFLASTKPYKGFYLLKKVLDEIYIKKPYEFELNVYGNVTEKSEYMNVYEKGFSQKDLPQIFSRTDILIAPSIWYETFGFTVLEALSYGVPVIVSDNVGSKDIINKAGIIVKANDKQSLSEVLENLNKNEINEYRRIIKKQIKIMEWKEFCLQIENLYSGRKNDDINA